MRTWFKYEYGFINIDEENLYMTNTGNWSEIEKLKEKSPKTSRSNFFNSLWTKLFLVLFFIGLLTMGIVMVGKHWWGFIILIAIPFIGFKVYRYFQTEIGSRYMIPRSKITSVSFEKNNATLYFNNIEGVQTSEKLENVSEKGRAILAEMFPSAGTAIAE